MERASKHCQYSVFVVEYTSTVCLWEEANEPWGGSCYLLWRTENFSSDWNEQKCLPECIHVWCWQTRRSRGGKGYRLCSRELKLSCWRAEGSCVCVFGPALHLCCRLNSVTPKSKLFYSLWYCRDIYLCLSDTLLLWKGEWTESLKQETSQLKPEGSLYVSAGGDFLLPLSAQWLAGVWLEWRLRWMLPSCWGILPPMLPVWFVFLSFQNQQSHMEDRQGHGPDECHRPATPKSPHLCDFAGYPDLGASAAECGDSDREGGTGAGIRLCRDWGR